MIEDRVAALRQGLGRAIVAASPVMLLLAVWGVVSYFASPRLLPSPLATVKAMFTSLRESALIDMQGGGPDGYLPHVWSTFWHVGVAALTGIGAGVMWVLIVNESSPARLVSNTILEFIRVLPPLILVPFVAIAIAASEWAHFATVAIYATLTTAVYAMNATRNVPSAYQSMAELLGANRWRRAVTVTLPAILPEMLGAVRLVFAFGLGISVVVEYLANPTGIGRVMKLVIAFSRVDLLIVGVMWTIVLALVFDAVTVLVFSLVVRWTERRQLIAWMSK
jgi:taurine transport system permease protein